MVPYEYAEQYPGSIVLVYSEPPPEELIRRIQAAGAMAIILTPKTPTLGKTGSFHHQFMTNLIIHAAAFTPGETYINTDNKDTTDVVIPVAEVLNVYQFYDELLDLTAQNISVEVLLTSEGK